MTPDFAPFRSRMRAADLPEAAIRCFEHYYDRLVSGDRGTLSEREIAPVGDLPDLRDLAGFVGPGAAALTRTVVIKLNGGLGTSMGMRSAKSLLPVKGGLTFLDVIARQVLYLRSARRCDIPLLLMDSFRTRDESLALLARYGDLAGELPLDFLQHKVPRIRADDLAPVAWPGEPELEWCPPGHGDLYLALETSGLLARLLASGVRYAFVSNADNLGAVLDLRILGYLAGEEIPFVMEVCPRTEVHRKGGHLGRLRGGGLVLRELAQCPPDELDAFQDVKRHRWFNTNNLWLDLRVLAELLAERDGVLGLPMIRNEKPVDPVDDASPRVIQLETAMGAALSVFPGARALRVPGERFAPVKSTSDLLVVRSDAYRLADDGRLLPAGVRTPLVDLDPVHQRTVGQLDATFPSGPPSLRECTRLTVRGAVRFGRDVVCRGEVYVDADVADGAVLSS